MAQPARPAWQQQLRRFWNAYGVSLLILAAAALWRYFPLVWFTLPFSLFLFIHGLVLYFRRYHLRMASMLFWAAIPSAMLPHISAALDAKFASESTEETLSSDWHFWLYLVDGYSPWVTWALVFGGVALCWINYRQRQAPATRTAGAPAIKQTAWVNVAGTVNNNYYIISSVKPNELVSPSLDPVLAADPSSIADQVGRLFALQKDIHRLSYILEASIRTDSVLRNRETANEFGELLAAEDTNIPIDDAFKAYTLLVRFWFEASRLTSDPKKRDSATQRAREYSARARQFGERV